MTDAIVNIGLSGEGNALSDVLFFLVDLNKNDYNAKMVENSNGTYRDRM